MAIPITPYTPGDPITPNVTYSLAQSSSSNFSWLLTSGIAEAHLQMTLTQPTDEKWSNVTTFHIDGEVAGRLIKIPDQATDYYFRVIGPPSLAYDSTLALKDLQMPWPADITPKPIPTDGTPIENGYYSLDALALPVGKFHSLSIIPANSGNLVGKHATDIQNQFIATVFGVNASGLPISHMCSLENTQQVVFNYDTAKAVLHLSAPDGAKFNYTCTLASFNGGSGGSLTPSSDADITGAWSFSNCTGLTMADSAPIQLGKGANAIKLHGSGTGEAVIEGGNGATLDIAVPVDFSEPITYQDTVSYNRVGTTGEPIFQRWVMPRATLTLKGFEGAGTFGFANADGSQNYIGIDATGNVSFLKNTNHSGASTFSAGVTMGQTLTVTGRATMNGGIILPNKDLFLGPSTRFIAETGNNLELRIDAPDGSFTVPYLTTKASAGTSSGNLEVGGAANVQGNLTVTLDAALNRSILMGPVTISRSANMLTFSSPVTFQGAMTFNAGVTMAQSLNCSSSLQVASALYVGDFIQTNTDLGKFTSASLKFQNTADSTEDLQLLTDAGGVYIRIARENFYMVSADPDPTDVLSVKEMDARYAKVVSLTKAAYTALATKDPTTIYLITDTTPRMWAIGDMEIVTADVPA